MARIPSLENAAAAYLRVVEDSRSLNTARTYRQALQRFLNALRRTGVNADEINASEIHADWLRDFIKDLRDYAPATEQLYLTALVGFYEFLTAEYELPLNLARLRSFVRRRQRRIPARLPQCPRENIKRVIAYVQTEIDVPGLDEMERLRRMRDRAFVLMLADTGLRIAEACALTRSQVDFEERRAVATIKGGRQSVVRFSERALHGVRVYLRLRAERDGATGRPLSALPVFARHDKGAGKRILAISTVGARNIVDRWVIACLGEGARGTITPHSFRHYFVTVVLRASGGNLRLAQELARHKNIAITQRYAHLSDDDLDRGYHEIFNDR